MRISGLNSGLDIEQIVSDLVRAQRIPMDRVFQQKVKAEWQRDAYRDVNSKLLRFRNLAFDMTLEGTYLKKSATSSRPDILTATASGQAVEGKYELIVTNLATAARYATRASEEWFDAEGEANKDGQFILGATEEGATTIEFKKGETLEQIAARINEKKLGIHAFAHGNKISFTTTATGADAKFFVDADFTEIFGGQVPDGAAVGVLQTQIDQDGEWVDVKGANAQVTINGIAVEYSSNTFTFNGITVNLLNLPSAEEGGEAAPATVQIEVRHDVDAVVEKVKEFVDLYNELVGELNGMLREEVFRDFGPLTDEQKEAMSDKEIELWEEKAKSGLLRSDSMIRSILSEMRMALGAAVKVGDDSQSLRQIGITTGAWFEYGRVYLDENKLRSALSEDPHAVRSLFTQDGDSDGEMGIARRLTSVLDRGMERIREKAGRATSVYDDSFLGDRIREYESRLEQMEERLRRFEEAQWRKFTAMETALGQLYAQSDWLYQQLMAMQG